MVIRSPIIVTVGHIDHGKTTLLDRIRGTAVAKSEAGLITQHVGASYIPEKTIKEICGELLRQFNVELKIPGLLFLDTPGHAAFITLRKRGGAVADLAILVIDLMEGFQEQTEESLTILKEYKTPFVVAATKVDKIVGWLPQKGNFLENIKKQREDVTEELEKKVYNLVAQFSERGFEAERFDRVKDFKKEVAIVPCSGITGEGIPELLMVLVGLSQHFLRDRLELSEKAKGTVLEVKETKGLGTTIDVVLYDGSIKKGDILIIGGREILVTKVKSLLRPKPLQELRIGKQFESVEEVHAADGIKIAAPNLEKVIPGSPLMAVKNEKEIEEAKKLLQKEIEEIEFEKNIEGVILKADSLGSLEALIKILREKNIPVRKAEVGTINRQDLVELGSLKNDLLRVALAFNIKVTDDMEKMAKDFDVKIFKNNVIYRLLEDYEKWVEEKTKREIEEKLTSIFRPCLIKVLPGFVFRQSHPAIFGIEIKKGLLKPGTPFKNLKGKIVGVIKEIQKEGRNIQEARQGDKVAISMEEPIIGRQIKEGEELISALSENDLKMLKEVFEHLMEGEKEVLQEFYGF
ncbi:MAG: translation initiation factor IF-2 [Candidatus Aenigmatarchaeota archaeon]